MSKAILNLSPLKKGEQYNKVTLDGSEYIQISETDTADTGVYTDPETVVLFGEGAEKVEITATADLLIGLLPNPLYGNNGGLYFETTFDYDSDTQELVGSRPC